MAFVFKSGKILCFPLHPPAPSVFGKVCEMDNVHTALGLFRLEKSFGLLSPALPPAPSRVPKCHRHTASKSLRGWGLQHCPSVTVPGTQPQPPWAAVSWGHPLCPPGRALWRTIKRPRASFSRVLCPAVHARGSRRVWELWGSRELLWGGDSSLAQNC